MTSSNLFRKLIQSVVKSFTKFCCALCQNLKSKPFAVKIRSCFAVKIRSWKLPFINLRRVNVKIWRERKVQKVHLNSSNFRYCVWASSLVIIYFYHSWKAIQNKPITYAVTSHRVRDISTSARKNRNQSLQMCSENIAAMIKWTYYNRWNKIYILYLT